MLLVPKTPQIRPPAIRHLRAIFSVTLSASGQKPKRPLPAVDPSSRKMVFGHFPKLHQNQPVPHEKSPSNPHRLNNTVSLDLPSDAARALRLNINASRPPARLTRPVRWVLISTESLPAGCFKILLTCNQPIAPSHPDPSCSRRRQHEPSCSGG